MIKLKKITEDDLEFARKLRNANRKYFFNSKMISQGEHQKWFEELKNNNLDFFIIWYNKERIGTISVHDTGYKIELGNIIIDQKHRHKGILRHVFEKINHLYQMSCELEVQADNLIAIEAYKKLGFEVYGLKMKMK